MYKKIWDSVINYKYICNVLNVSRVNSHYTQVGPGYSLHCQLHARELENIDTNIMILNRVDFRLKLTPRLKKLFQIGKGWNRLRKLNSNQFFYCGREIVASSETIWTSFIFSCCFDTIHHTIRDIFSFTGRTPKLLKWLWENNSIKNICLNSWPLTIPFFFFFILFRRSFELSAVRNI